MSKKPANKLTGLEIGTYSIGAGSILRVFMFLAPIPLIPAGYPVYHKKYWLYGERYDKIKKEIDERRTNGAEKP